MLTEDGEERTCYNIMSSVAIITARGGSKRIPKKNIKLFCGKPIIAYSIEAALQSGCFDTVMVSTDSEEIASIAKKYGAHVPFLRSTTTSNDYATTADVLCEVIHEYELRGQYYDTLCCIYPTAPFITADKLEMAIKMYHDIGGDSLIPVVRYSFPPQRAMLIRDGFLKYQYPQYERSRSQDLEPIYHDCGQFYICSTSMLLKRKSLIGDRLIPFEIPEEEVQDIDTLSDWVLAETKYKTFVLKENR